VQSNFLRRIFLMQNRLWPRKSLMSSKQWL
jgi:hypothetical protein